MCRLGPLDQHLPAALASTNSLLHHITSRHITSHHIISCHITWYPYFYPHPLAWHVISHDTSRCSSCHAVLPYTTILDCVISWQLVFTLPRIAWHCITLHCIVHCIAGMCVNTCIYAWQYFYVYSCYTDSAHAYAYAMNLQYVFTCLT